LPGKRYPMRPPRVLLVAAAIGLLAIGMLTTAGCGSAATATTSTCPTSALRISLDMNAAGVAAGSSFVPLEFRNVSARRCALPGYPLVSLADSSAGPGIAEPAVRADSSHAQRLILARGELAHAWLQIVAAANYPPSRCKPVTAGGLRVSLATTATASFVAHAIPACARAPAGNGIIIVFPVQAGRARQGTAP
jgi:hypothetical protein